ncbi:MAG: hypothetical protein HOC26_13360 [Chloroflexi bacterium]|jgi:hypothetical protein|nr:hypothetical protein [Chloroflexota bacterium]
MNSLRKNKPVRPEGPVRCVLSDGGQRTERKKDGLDNRFEICFAEFRSLNDLRWSP